MIHHLQSHLDKVDTYARVLFIDFSSASNTIQPHLMIKKLMIKNVNSELTIFGFINFSLVDNNTFGSKMPTQKAPSLTQALHKAMS